MTTLQFKYQDLEIDDLSDINDNDLPGVLSETAFFIPTRLLLNEVNVFEFLNNKGLKVEWVQIPAFSILLDWKAALSDLPSKKKIFLLPPSGEVEIVFENGRIRLRTNFSRNNAEDSYEEFNKGVQLGIVGLREVLDRRIPDSLKERLARANALGFDSE